MKNILEKIVEKTRSDVSSRKKRVSEKDFHSFEEYHRSRKDFVGNLRKSSGVSVIAEIKKASPSQGVIREDFHPALIAQSYEENGASAISVLTEETFFKGGLVYLQEVSAITKLPVLRKDFIVDEYQLAEARAWGADAVLIIAKITDGQQMYDLLDAAREMELQALVECYDMSDWARMDFSCVEVVGVNNRDLETFQVDLHRGTELLKLAPESVVKVSESGIGRPEDLLKLAEQGVHSALIGEHFMRASDPGTELARFTAVFPEHGHLKMG